MVDQYEAAATAALQRRLNLLDDAKRRGVHTQEEYDRLRKLIIQEQQLTWQMPFVWAAAF